MFFCNSLTFSMIQQMLAIWPLVPLPFLKPAWASGSSWFTYCWSLAWKIIPLYFFITLEDYLVPINVFSPSPLICSLSLWICLSWIFHINGIIQYVTFCVWFLSLNVFKVHWSCSILSFYGCMILHRASLVAQLVKNLSAMQEMLV